MDIMFDLETLGLPPDGVILTFGAVKFDAISSNEPHDPIYYKIDTDYQISELGRTIDDSVMEWWGKQDSSVFEDAFSDDDRISVNDFIGIFKKYVVGVDRLWCHGLTFDITLMENLFKSMNTPFPVNYWSLYDSRSLLKLMKNNPLKKDMDLKHNSLVDAYYQANAIQQAAKEFNITKN